MSFQDFLSSSSDSAFLLTFGCIGGSANFVVIAFFQCSDFARASSENRRFFNMLFNYTNYFCTSLRDFRMAFFLSSAYFKRKANTVVFSQFVRSQTSFLASFDEIGFALFCFQISDESAIFNSFISACTSSQKFSELSFLSFEVSSGVSNNSDNTSSMCTSGFATANMMRNFLCMSVETSFVVSQVFFVSGMFGNTNCFDSRSASFYSFYMSTMSS